MNRSRFSAQRAVADEVIAQARGHFTLSLAVEGGDQWLAGDVDYGTALARLAQLGAEAERVLLENGWAFLQETRPR